MTEKAQDTNPAGDVASFWNSRAAESLSGAVCWHHDMVAADEKGIRDADYLWGIIERLPCTLGIPARTVVLDLGGGYGRIAKHLAPKVHRYVLADVSTVMLKGASEHLKGMDNVLLVDCENFQLKALPDEYFDFIFACMCFQHCDREITLRYLIECRRLLKPLGRLWFHVPLLDYPRRLNDQKHWDWPGNLRRWTVGELTELLLRLEFGIVEMDCDGIEVLAEKPHGEKLLGWEGIK